VKNGALMRDASPRRLIVILLRFYWLTIFIPSSPSGELAQPVERYFIG